MASKIKTYTVQKLIRFDGGLLEEGDTVKMEEWQARQFGKYLKPYKKQKKENIKEDNNE